MNIFAHFHDTIITSIRALSERNAWGELDLSKVNVEPPKDPSHGDMALNAAFILAKSVKQSPKDVAALLISELKAALPSGTSLAIAGAGFINITFSHAFWQQHLALILEQGASYGPRALGKNKKVHIEFVSANPTGPMHTGHSRNAVVGDSIASVLEAVGFDVHREYYINDAGAQMDTLARSVHLRYRQLFGDIIPDEAFEGLYPGDYVKDMARRLKDQKGDTYYQQDEDVWLQNVREFATREAMDSIQNDLKKLGVVMDTYTSETKLALDGKIDAAVRALEDAGDVYIGTLTPPKGHVIEDFEDRPQTLFRATKYGDTIDRPLKKADGSWAYFAPDIAYHLDKFQRGFDDLIDVLGVDHIGYFSRLQAAVKAITKGKARFEIHHYNNVNFLEDGVPLKMSKRAGNFIMLSDLLDKVGKDIVRFMMMSRHHNSVIDFDFKKVVEQTKDNPIFYIQYAHARICSVMRHAHALWPTWEQDYVRMDSDEKHSCLSILKDEHELNLVRTLSVYPRTIEVAAHLREPHRLSYYLYDLAAAFHSLWNKGKDQPQLRFIDEKDKNGSVARLALLKGTQTVLASCLNILKIEPVQEMH